MTAPLSALGPVVAEPVAVTNRAARWLAWKVAVVGIVGEAFLEVYPVLHDALEGDDAVQFPSLGRLVAKALVGAALGFLWRRFSKPPADLAPAAAVDATVAAGAEAMARVLPATAAALEDLAPVPGLELATAGAPVTVDDLDELAKVLAVELTERLRAQDKRLERTLDRALKAGGTGRRR